MICNRCGYSMQQTAAGWTCFNSYCAAKLPQPPESAMQKQLEAERARVGVLREGMGHILDYWNRDQNETAMADALWHIIETADEALAATAPEAPTITEGEAV